MDLKKTLVLNGGQIQQLQSGDYLNTSGLFDPTSNLGGVSGLATNGITVHNGTAWVTRSLAQPASGMTISNADGVSGNPTFAFTDELSALLGLATGIVAKNASGSLAARTLTGTTNQIAVTNGTGVSGNPTFAIASNPVIPGNASMTVPTGTTGERPTGVNGMMRYNSTDGKFEFYQGGAWVEYGVSNTVGTVTSVDVALPTSVFSASSGAITSSGTITFTLNSQSANTVFAAPNGSSGTPTFRSLVAVDIPNLDWSKITTGKPTTLAGYGITDGALNTITISAGAGLTGGGDLTANRTISMPNVGTPVATAFVQITTDAQGRVSATNAVAAGDITTALTYTPVNKAGDTMSGNLTMDSGTHITLPDSPVNATDATNKAYVDERVTSGTVWKNPIVDPDIQDVVTAKPTSFPGAFAGQTFTYIYEGAGETFQTGGGASITAAAGDVVQIIITNGYGPAGDWSIVDTLSAGDRFIIAGEHGDIGYGGTTNLFDAGFRKNDLIEYVSGDPTTFAAWTTPQDGGYQVIDIASPVLASDSTGLGALTTYDIKVSIDGTVHTLSLVSTAGTELDTYGELATALTTALNAVYPGASAVLEPEGHIHVYSGDGTKVIISNGVGSNPLLTALADFNEVLAGIQDGVTVLCNDPDSEHYSHTYVYTAGVNSWTEIAGPGAIGAGVGLSYAGSTLNINLGAGIVELPSDEVGLDIVSDLALQLTSNLTGGQLTFVIDGDTLTQSGSGLKVADGGITGTQLNTSVAGAGLSGGGGAALSVNVDGSTLEMDVDTLRIKDAGVTAAKLAAAVAGLGLTNSGTALNVNVDGSSLELNSDTLRVKAGGVTNTMLANSTISLAGTSGSGTVALGSTLTISGSNGITTTASAGAVQVALSAALDNLSDVTITSPAAGDVIYRNGSGQFVNGQPGATSGVQAYDATLQALAGLTSTPGMVVETGTDAFTTRVIAGTSGRITVANGDGISGDPTIDLASGIVTAGTYSSVTVDTYGRVTAGSATEANTQISLINSNAGTLPIGTPVYIITAGHVDKGDAGTSGQQRVVGLVADAAGIATTAAGNISIAGVLTATTGQWDAVVTGGSGGLSAGAVYFLEPGTAGKLTTTAPSGAGEYVAPVGIALSTTQFKIAIDPTIQL